MFQFPNFQSSGASERKQVLGLQKKILNHTYKFQFPNFQSSGASERKEVLGI